MKICVRSPPAMRSQMAARRCRVREYDGVFQTLLCRSWAGPSPAFHLDLAAKQSRKDDGSSGQSLAIRSNQDDVSGRPQGIQPRFAAIQRRADDEDVSGLSLGIQPRLVASRRRVDDECSPSRSLGIQPRLAANRCRIPRCSVTTRFPLIHLLDWLVCWALWLSRQ